MRQPRYQRHLLKFWVTLRRAGRWAGERPGQTPPLAILGLGLAAFVIYGFPGLMTWDSFDQLAEARAGSYNDAHPPAMAALWRQVDAVVAGPFGMLLVQGATFLVGVYLILGRVMSRRRAAAATLILLSPPVLTTMIVIWKDCLMAGFLVLGAGLILDERRWMRGLGLLALVMATAVRYNAPAATLPLIVVVFVWSPPAAGAGRWRAALSRYGQGLAAWVVVTLLAFGCNHALTDRSVSYWYSSAAVADIVGTLRHVDRTIPDDELRRILVGCPLTVTENIHQTMRERYQPWNFLHLVIAGPSQMFDLPLDRDPPPALKAAMTTAWRRVVTSHPGAYLRHRWWTFKEVLGVTKNFPWGSAVRHQDQNPGRMAELGIGMATSRFQRAAHKKVVWMMMHTQFMRPYLYVLLALALLPLCRRSRDAFAILASGLTVEASLFPTALTPDLRYSHWLMVCALLAAVILFARRRAEGRSAWRARVGAPS